MTNVKKKKNSDGILWFHKNQRFIKTEDGGYLFDCAFCLRRKVRANKDFYIRNRNKVQFWTKNYPNSKLICSSCLFDLKEIDIEKNRKDIFYVYKNRYLKEQSVIKNHGSD